MEIRITGINFHYDNDGEIAQVNIRHDGVNSDRTILNNGQVIITKQEYEENKTLENLILLVKERLSNELNAE